MGRLPGRDARPTRCASRCGCSCRAARPGSRGPTFYTQWDREVGALLTARAPLHAGHPPRRRRAQLVGVRHSQRRVRVRRGAAPLAQLRRRSRPAPATSPAARSRSSWPSSTSAAAILTTGDYLLRLADVAREMGYDPATDFKLTRAAEHRRPRAARGDVRRRVLRVVRVPRGAVGGGGVPGPRRAAHLRGRLRRADRRPRDRRAAARRRARRRSCITELYKTGSPQFRYNIMDLSYLYPRGQCACGSWLRKMAPFAGPRRQHGEAARRQRVARGASASSRSRSTGSTPDWFVRAVRRRQPRRAGRSRWSATRDPSAFPAIARRGRDAAQGPPRCADRGRGRRARGARRVDRGRRVAEVEAVPR